MSVEIKTLDGITVKNIHSTFVEAFSDYQVDISYMTPYVMKNRFAKNGFQPKLSVGVFEQNNLKGFTIVGTGNFKNGQAAFDIMTGLVKDYRGKGLANKMFDLIKEKMKEQAIEKFYLEVLQENEPAIKAYEKTGFTKVRELNCYVLKAENLKLVKKIQTVVYIQRANKATLDIVNNLQDWEPSWENHFEAIKRIPDHVDIFTARHLGKEVGLLIYYPTLNWLMSLAVHKDYRRKGIATALLEYLFEYVNAQTREIKILNVQSDDEGLNNFLMKSGCEKYTGQYEMEFALQ